MILSFLKMIFLNLSFFQIGQLDTTNIEQVAFDEFISRVDSIALMNHPKRKYFQKDSSKIYFSGETGFYSAMPFVLNRICRRKDFIIIDTAKDYAPGTNSWIYPQKGNKKIISKANFVVLDKRKSKRKSLNAGDLRLFMSNRYYHNGFYYVKFIITQDIIETSWYYKLNEHGKVLDIAMTAAIY